MRRPKKRAKQHSSTGGEVAVEAMYELILAVFPLYFGLRAAGQRHGQVSEGGGGVWGFLRSLKQDGPQTVPSLARARPVARQYIQTLANAFEREGLIEFTDNPAHKRSKLMRLTAKGEARFSALDQGVLQACAKLAAGLDALQIKASAALLRQLKMRVDAL
jgi:DNA-binding MarR family transcriptional regulator